ncbi:hypothetical protein [Psychrobacillus sp. L4]
MRHLEILNISENKIVKIPADIVNLTELRMLDAGHNEI